MSTAVPNHRRVKPGAIKPGPVSSGVTGPSSQIPGLSQTSDTSPTERISCRRVGIFESDSDYVKLAKQGGHKGLLSHDVVDDDDAPRKAYSPSYFFGDDSKSGSNGNSPDGEPKGRQPLTAPFGTDSEVHWEKESDRFTGNQKASPDGAVQQMEAMSITHKYKRTSYEKKAPPVSMSKLLSHGYVEEKKSQDDDTSSVTSEMTSTVATDDVGVDDLE